MDNGTRTGSGDYLPFAKINDFSQALAVIIEPLGYRKDVPGTYGIRDIVDTHLTIFFTEEQLRGEDDPIIKDVAFDKKTTTTDLIARMEEGNYEGTVVKPTFLPPTPAKAGFWVWRKVDPAVFDLVVAYVEKVNAFEPEWA